MRLNESRLHGGVPRPAACRIVAYLLVGVLLIPAAQACNVPVFRYALERWPADPHVASFRTNLPMDRAQLQPATDANLWCEFAREPQTQDVRVVYPDIFVEWYRGDYDEGLLTRLSDSPLRRALAQELLTGKAVAFVLLESSNAATNNAVCALLESRLELLKQEIEIPEILDYSDDTGTAKPVGRDVTGTIPTRLDFTVHRLGRDSAPEASFVRQLVGMDEQLRDVTQPAIFAVFGRARCIPVFGEALTADLIDELCWFLCSACSCRAKAMNPGIDLLFAVNWEEAIFSYPEPVVCVLPDGRTYEIGGTQPVSRASTAREVPGPKARDQHGGSAGVLYLAAGAVLVLALCLVLFRRK